MAGFGVFARIVESLSVWVLLVARVVALQEDHPIVTDRGRTPRRPRSAAASPVAPLHLDEIPCRSICLHCLVSGIVEPLRSRRAGRLRRGAGVLAAAALVTAGVAAPAAVPRPIPALRVETAAHLLSLDSTTTSTSSAPKPAAPAPAPAPAPDAAPAPPPAPPADPPTGPGYRLVAADGGVFTHGWFASHGAATGLAKAPIKAVAQTKDGEGYWLAGADGSVYAFGGAGYFGGASGLAASPVVDMAATPSGNGYWLVTADGGVFAFGDAPYAGSGAEVAHTSRIAAIASTASGNGYWLVATDGGVFAFGDAGFFGGAADLSLSRSIVSLVPTPSGNGYWLVSSDGGVFAFGDAGFFGGLADQALRRPIVDMASTASGNGYWLVSSDGGVFAFGDAPFIGSSASARLNAPITAIAAGVGTHEPPPPPPAPDPAPAPAPAAPASAPAPATKNGKGNEGRNQGRGKTGKGSEPADGRRGWDISWPQCGGSYPDGLDFAVIGVTGGKAFTGNPCLEDQWKWARSQSRAAGVYFNINFPKTADDVQRGLSSPYQPDCAGSISCIAFNYGWNSVKDGLAYARSQHVDVPFVWLDVEVLNYWTPDKAVNAVVVRGAIEAAKDSGLEAGIYSTPLQWGRLMGDEAPGVPVWSAGADTWDSASAYCSTKGFGGGPVALVQLLPAPLDTNVVCPGAGPVLRYFAP